MSKQPKPKPLVMHVNVFCPYCGVKVQTPVQMRPIPKVHQVLCDRRNGGCGDTFAVRVDFRPYVRVARMDWVPSLPKQRRLEVGQPVNGPTEYPLAGLE